MKVNFMPLRSILLISILLVMFCGKAKSDTLSQTTASDFLTFCTQTLPNFNSISKLAEEKNLSADQPPGETPEGFKRVNGWKIDKNIENYHLFVAEFVKEGKILTSCGIVAPNAVGAEVRKLIQSKLQLGPSVNDDITWDKTLNRAVWKINQESEDASLVLIYGSLTGVNLSVTSGASAK